MNGLFDEIRPSTPSSPNEAKSVATVAVEQAVDRELDYLVPTKLRDQIAIGQRVRVPLGRSSRHAFACVVGLKDHSDFSRSRLKELDSIDDPRSLLRPRLLELARWMSRYYLTPLGTVLESVIPSAVKKRTGLGHVTLVRAARSHAELREIVAGAKKGKTPAVLAALLQLAPDESIEITRLATAAGTTIATIRKLGKQDLLHISRETDFTIPSGPADGEFAPQAPLNLNAEQQKAVDALLPLISPPRFSIALLHGITGSGKTEIYLHCIREVVSSGRQAIVLVPEIALTPQTAHRFTRRFEHVAILHSGMSATERHHHWRNIAAGKAQVVVGARSAVFAPVPNLGLIVVDEEHESSYKQETAPRYHARDVAIKRAQTENVPIILGSATPSLEMYHRIRAAASQPLPASQPRTHEYLHLSSRATVHQLPKVELIDMKRANVGRPGVHLLSPRLEQMLSQTLLADHQAILLLNRRGYASYIWCPSCGNELQCKYCDVSMVYHRHRDAHVGSGRSDLAVHTGTLRCHYCLAENPLPQACPQCGKKLSLFGLGTQRVEEELLRKFPQLRFARIDSDTMNSSRDYERVLGEFGSGKVQLLMGTQMIAKGLDFPNVTLVGVISGDTALMLPDFRSAERTFQIITQVAGRAGRGEKPGTVIVQTCMPDDPTIRAAIKQDYNAFAARELSMRKQAMLPPFGRMARLVMRDTQEDRLKAFAQRIGDRLRQAASGVPDIHLEGPMDCAISRIAGYLRQQIVLSSPRSGSLQQVLGALRKEGTVMQAERIAIDVDPVSLL